MKELLPANDRQTRITPTVVVLHSAAGAARDLHGWWMNPQSQGLECHFYVDTDGTVFQYMDTNVRADANMQANRYGISIETENHSGVGFDADPWAPQQLDALVALVAWCCDTHRIPKTLCTDGRHGVGWHEQYPQWTTRGHHCPGTTRVNQLRSVLLPRIAGDPPAGTEDELDAPQAKQLADTAAMLPAVFVDILYRTYGGRDADPAGLEYWSSQVAATNPLSVFARLSTALKGEKK